MSSWWSALNPFAGVNAEEVHAEKEEKEDEEEGDEEDDEDEDDEDDEDDDDDEEGDDAEEEEEEPEDPKPALVEHAQNHLCPTEKHHFDACAARVANAQESEHQGHTEDCAEEFLHLMHCVDKSIAEPLFRLLK